MAAISIENLTKRYDDVVAVDGLTLQVPEGEVFGFLGPNGAGKSTTINVLLDFIRPTAGRVSVLGHDPQTAGREVRSRVGILPEGYDLYDRLSARKHVEFAADMEGTDDDPDAILDRVGLEADADRKVGGFSTGMRQRLALGMALVGDPDLLVLDEPSSGLDPNGIREMRDIVREERDRGTTVFFSSHVLDQVEAVCDRVGILSEGKLVAVDTVEGLRASTDTESTLVVSVDEVPRTDPIESLDGVADVSVDDSTLRVACSDSGVKAEIISQVETAGATVTDIESEETTLEDLFTEYTTADAPEGEA